MTGSAPGAGAAREGITLRAFALGALGALAIGTGVSYTDTMVRGGRIAQVPGGSHDGLRGFADAVGRIGRERGLDVKVRGRHLGRQLGRGRPCTENEPDNRQQQHLLHYFRPPPRPAL